MTEHPDKMDHEEVEGVTLMTIEDLSLILAMIDDRSTIVTIAALQPNGRVDLYAVQTCGTSLPGDSKVLFLSADPINPNEYGEID